MAAASCWLSLRNRCGHRSTRGQILSRLSVGDVQILTSLSAPPVAARRPSGLTATASAPPGCALAIRSAAGRNVPDLHAVIERPGGDLRSVLREGGRQHEVRVTEVRAQRLTRGHVPQLQAPVEAAGDGQLPVGGKVEGVDLVDVSGESGVSAGLSWAKTTAVSLVTTNAMTVASIAKLRHRSERGPGRLRHGDSLTGAIQPR